MSPFIPPISSKMNVLSCISSSLCPDFISYTLFLLSPFHPLKPCLFFPFPLPPLLSSPIPSLLSYSPSFPNSPTTLFQSPFPSSVLLFYACLSRFLPAPLLRFFSPISPFPLSLSPCPPPTPFTPLPREYVCNYSAVHQPIF